MDRKTAIALQKETRKPLRELSWNRVRRRTRSIFAMGFCIRASATHRVVAIE
jgi:hypothetical protein